MSLHARSVTASAGTPPEYFDRVLDALIESGEIKVHKARALLAEMTAGDKASGREAAGEMEVHGTGAGKVILLGEHAAVYDRHVLALPLDGAVAASIRESSETRWIFYERNNDRNGERRFTVRQHAPAGLPEMLDLILKQLGMNGRAFEIRLRSRIPRAAGLGSSAAVAVAILRAFDHVFTLRLTDEAINELAFACEKLAHGNPSGIDNTVATYGRAVLFRKSATPPARPLELTEVPPIVIAASGMHSVTKDQVTAVRDRHARMTDRYNAIFDEIDEISMAGATALTGRDYAELGALMNLCQGLLNAVGVSTPELEKMVDMARRNGAAGAKLTGAGGGGSIVALCPGTADRVEQALRAAGYRII
jgi:hydroxymethylglutaryl-CoA reductase